jgi:hypothetical protein
MFRRGVSEVGGRETPTTLLYGNMSQSFHPPHAPNLCFVSSAWSEWLLSAPFSCRCPLMSKQHTFRVKHRGQFVHHWRGTLEIQY